MAEGRRRSGGPRGSDWLLGGLVGLVHGVEREGARLHIPVTLSVGGFIVSGYVISGQEYFENFSQMVAAGMPDAFNEETMQSIVESFRKLSDAYAPTEEEEIEDITRGRYSFIHLRDTQFLHPGGDPVPSDAGMLWRSKLEAVDGFTLGMLRATPIEEEPDDIESGETEPDE